MNCLMFDKMLWKSDITIFVSIYCDTYIYMCNWIYEKLIESMQILRIFEILIFKNSNIDYVNK